MQLIAVAKFKGILFPGFSCICCVIADIFQFQALQAVFKNRTCDGCRLFTTLFVSYVITPGRGPLPPDLWDATCVNHSLCAYNKHSWLYNTRDVYMDTKIICVRLSPDSFKWETNPAIFVRDFQKVIFLLCVNKMFHFKCYHLYIWLICVYWVDFLLSDISHSTPVLHVIQWWYPFINLQSSSIICNGARLFTLWLSVYWWEE